MLEVLKRLLRRTTTAKGLYMVPKDRELIAQILQNHEERITDLEKSSDPHARAGRD